MIRINLLGQTRQKTAAVALFDPSRRVPVGAVLIVLTAFGAICAWYITLDRASKRVERDILATQQQSVQLKPVLAEVQAYEERRAQLQQRVALIEQLRGGQSVPVQLLDAISRSVPDLLWLTQLDQGKTELTIEGRSTTLIALSDFVGNLGSTGLLQKPIEIISSQVESLPSTAPQGSPADVIKFAVKAQLIQPAEPVAVVAGAAVTGGAR